MENHPPTIENLPKSRTGIKGFDEITFGGLPRGRPALVTGGAGSGKTLFGMEFLVRGAVDYAEPGVFFSFEESEEDLISNFHSLGFNLNQLRRENKIALDYVHIDRSEIEETGEYNLEGLFVRLGYAIDSIGARRIVLDTLEALFSGFTNQMILRSEIRRLFRWIKDRRVTAVVTAERGDREGGLTRHGLEEYVSDCVIVLDHRLQEQLSTRRLRVAKYRGSTHGTNEYPFVIDEGGITVLPITSVGLDYEVATDRISTGVPRLDTMLAGQGFYRGSSVLVSGTAGTGKTTFAAQFVNETCGNGERCLYFAFEESSSQVIRNMRSVGLDLASHRQSGLLRFNAVRPTFYGLEMHLSAMHKTILEFNPAVIVVDPISNLISIGDPAEVKIALMRLVDLLKSRMITSLFTTLLRSAHDVRRTNGDVSPMVSSLIDTWILLKGIESAGETNRLVTIIKSRGMAHSNQLREFTLSGHGIDIKDVYSGPDGVWTGAARAAQEAREKTERIRSEQELVRKKREFELTRATIETQIGEMRARLASQQEELERTVAKHQSRMTNASDDREQMARLRMADEKVPS